MIENIGAYSQIAYDRGYKQGRADAIDEVMVVVKTKISEKEYPLHTMVELTVLGAKIEQLKEQNNGCDNESNRQQKR